MENKVKVYEMVSKADILNDHLADTLEIDASQLTPPDNGINYELTVDFSHKRIQDEAQIMAFPVEDRPHIKSSSYRDRVGDVLAKQLSRIESRFTSLGYDILNCSINGEELEEPDKIIIRLFKGEAKEFDKKGRPMHMKVYSIAPSVPGLQEIIKKALARITLERKREMELAAKKKEEHKPNNVFVRELFESIAHGIYMDQRIINKQKTDRIQEAATNLLTSFKVQKEWPLEMSGHIGENSKGDCTLQQVDCSEWMVYSQDKEGIWSLKAIESADEARKVVERDIVNKSTDVIVVLQHQIPASYSLMVQGKLGLSLIEKKDASQYKRVQVVWGNANISPSC